MASKRIHITGAHRSGTTLLCALLASCFEIDVVVPDEHRLRTPLDWTGSITCSKCADETGYAFRLLPLDPDLHTVHILRDPRDVLVSRYMPQPERYFTNLRCWRRNKPGSIWARHRRAHLVRYEHLVRQPDDVQAHLAAGMPFLRRVCAFSMYSERARELASSRNLYWPQAMHSIRPPTTASIGTWQQHPERVKGQILRHGDISKELIELGYERDRNWLSLLEGREPDLTPSHMPEDDPLKSRVTRTWRDALGMFDYVRARRRERTGSNAG